MHLTKRSINSSLEKSIPPFVDFETEAGVKKTWIYTGAVLAFLYLARLSVLYIWIAPMRPLFIFGGQALLGFAFVLILSSPSRRRVLLSGISLIGLTLPGSLFSDLFTQSLLKWVGWVLLFFVVGPVFQSLQARTIRSSAWTFFRLSFVFIGVGSFAWYLLGLPSYWRGSFTGVMTYSMLLAPMAALSALVCLNYALLKRSAFWVVLSFLSIPSCLLAGSRLAVLSLAAGLIVLLGIHFMRGGRSRRSVPKIMFFLFFSFIVFSVSQSMNSSSALVDYTETLVGKGTYNTREHLWTARWKEFNENPIAGIGIGLGQGAGVAIDSEGDVNVEPGSSYLALLSMTGLFGAFGALFVCVSTYKSARMGWRSRFSDPFFPEVLSITAFLFVHMAAEGWLLAVGSPLCLLFWLCLGRIKDLELKSLSNNSVVKEGQPAR